ncbi:hypothetical protein TNCV_1382071 [Trichonephila clavipes]|nr:hypothetical protein TNCV_1382071 [Trichonephila clavipes]
MWFDCEKIRTKRRNGYQLVSECYCGRIVVCREGGLLFRDITTLIDRNQKFFFTNRKLMNSGGSHECHAGSQRPSVSNDRVEKHVFRSDSQDHTATSRTSCREVDLLAIQISTQIVQWCLKQHGLSIGQPFLRLPLTL